MRSFKTTKSGRMSFEGNDYILSNRYKVSNTAYGFYAVFKFINKSNKWDKIIDHTNEKWIIESCLNDLKLNKEEKEKLNSLKEMFDDFRKQKLSGVEFETYKKTEEFNIKEANDVEDLIIEEY